MHITKSNPEPCNIWTKKKTKVGANVALDLRGNTYKVKYLVFIYTSISAPVTCHAI